MTWGSFNHWLHIANTVDHVSTVDRTIGMQALDLLLTAYWGIEEGKALGFSVSRDQARQRLALIDYDHLENIDFQWFPGEQRLRPYLFSPALTNADRVWLIKAALLLDKVDAHLLAKARYEATRADVMRYYKGHQSEFVAVELREVDIIETRTMAVAIEARRAIEAGEPFRKVSERISVDPRTKTGRLLLDRFEGEAELGVRIFSAAPHVLIGPLRQAIFYLFDVRKIVPRHEMTLAQSKRQIIKDLGVRRFRSYQRPSFERMWRSRTVCGIAYRNSHCGRVLEG